MQGHQDQDAVLAALAHLQTSVDTLRAESIQRHTETSQWRAETRTMIEDLNMRVTRMDERLTEYQEQRLPVAYQRFGHGQRPPSFTQRGDHPSSSSGAPPS